MAAVPQPQAGVSWQGQSGASSSDSSHGSPRCWARWACAPAQPVSWLRHTTARSSRLRREGEARGGPVGGESYLQGLGGKRSGEGSDWLHRIEEAWWAMWGRAAVPGPRSSEGRSPAGLGRAAAQTQTDVDGCVMQCPQPPQPLGLALLLLWRPNRVASPGEGKL